MANRRKRRTNLAAQYASGIRSGFMPTRRELYRQERALLPGKDALYNYLTALGGQDASAEIAGSYDAAREALTADLAKTDVSSGAAADITSILGGAIGADATTTANTVAQLATNPNLDAATRSALVADASLALSQDKIQAQREASERSREARFGAAQRKSDLAAERRGLRRERADLIGQTRAATTPYAIRGALRAEASEQLSYADAVRSFKNKYGRLPTRKEIADMNDDLMSGGGQTFIAPGLR